MTGVRLVTSTPADVGGKHGPSLTEAGTGPDSQRPRARAKPLELSGLDGSGGDFLSRLEEAEERDTYRLTERSNLSFRSFADCTSPPESPQAGASTPAVPPIEVLPLTVTVMSDSGRRKEGLITVERSASARTRSTPRPSPHPSTPRAPRAERTPNTGSQRSTAAVGFQGFGSPRPAPTPRSSRKKKVAE